MTSPSKDFCPLSIASLLKKDETGNPYHFIIPSFQRGYRWEEKQVYELLNDLSEFVTQNQGKSYFLQPIVVRKDKNKPNTWEVLDGQQRLTTMYLLLNTFFRRITDDDKDQYTFYDISYIERPTPDFASPVPQDNLDSFYLYRAKNAIEEWYKSVKQDNKLKLLDNIRNALFYTDNEKQVKLIWYVVPEGNEGKNDLSAIKIFNRLNKGKISLTSSELIKALFIINVEQNQQNETHKIDLDRLSLEWDRMEKCFQDDSFWYFISNRKEDIQTRIDILFDFIANIDSTKVDSMDTYRYFQRIYDDISSHNYNEFSSYEQLWEKTTIVFDIFMHWFEDTCIYNYIGFLIWEGLTPLKIYTDIENAKRIDANWDKDKLVIKLRQMIKDIVAWQQYQKRTNRNFEDWIYHDSSDYKKIREALLLFNIESYTKANLRFPFDEYKKQGWDVEHVDSQKDNNMQKIEDKIEWLMIICDLLQYDPSAHSLYKEGNALLNQFRIENQDQNNAFVTFYSKVYQYYSNSSNEENEKDTIDNLALLNCGINRSYQNAPFPYKRTAIIKNDIAGIFVPMCTKNLFLKYYTGVQSGASQLDMIRWSESDRKAYMTQLLSTLNYYL